VNVTVGLPFVRTGADDGTAFDILGTDWKPAASLLPQRIGVDSKILHQPPPFRLPAVVGLALGQIHPESSFEVRVPLRIPFG